MNSARSSHQSAPTLYLWGGTALTMNSDEQIVKNALIGIRDERIVSIESQKYPEPPAGVKEIDCRGCLILPGFINAHTHVGMTLLRGVADDLPLREWLFDRIFPLEKKWGNKEFVYFGTLLATIEAVRSGTTTFNDMYYFEEAAAKAIHESGMRAICGQTIVEISGVEKPAEIFEKFDQFLSDISAFPRVKAGIAPHSIYGVSEKVWPEVIEYAKKRDLLIHLHLSETQSEMDECFQKMGKSPTEFFEEIGLWSQRVLAAHATCVNEKDIEILGRYKVGIAHNPESNLKLGTKICPVVELRAAGANVALGTDSVASNNNLDLLQEADTAAKLQAFQKGVGKLPAKEVCKMLTLEGARALGLDREIGSIEVGKLADLIAIHTDAAHAVPLYDPYSHVVYSAQGGDVRHTLVGGTVLLEDWRIQELDESGILREAKRWGEKIAASGQR